ncbi:hypothetical protein PRNP1_001508 [Phytophthora ramorum]
MKIFASSLLAAAMAAALVRADTCDTASVTALLTSDDVTTCASDSGYSPSSLATPTDAEMEVMCTSTSCQSVLSDLTKMFVKECTVGTFALYADLITPVTTFCSSLSSSTSSSSSAGTNSSASTAASTTSEAASATSEAASAGSVAIASSASLDSAQEVTVAPIATNTTSSASSDDDVTVGDSESGSDLAIETLTPTTSSESASATTDSTSSASSAADDTSSGSSAGVAVSPSAALLGSALVATAALFL